MPKSVRDVSVSLAFGLSFAGSFRLLPSGEVDVTGNSRTGVAKETFMDKPKNVNYVEVELTLLYYAATRDSQDAREAADHVFHYAISR